MASAPISPPAAKRLKLDSSPNGSPSRTPLPLSVSHQHSNGNSEGHAPSPPSASSAPPPPPVASTSAAAESSDEEDEEQVRPAEDEDVGRRDMYLDTVSCHFASVMPVWDSLKSKAAAKSYTQALPPFILLTGGGL